MLPDMQYLPHFVSTKDQNCKHICQSWCQDVITSNYGYVLKQYRTLKDKYPIENLEQNRLLGIQDINVIQTKYNGIEINTETDLNSWTV